MSRLTFHLIPHTHWDREWYLTRAAFQARLVPMLDDVLDQLEADPATRFVLDGQTILVEDYLAVRPEQEQRVRAQVERGALEVGPWYVLADLLVPSAESLRKNLEVGRQQADRLGNRLEVLYSPDAFGHPEFLPSLAAEFGLPRAVIRRGLDKSGDFYRWEAPDGKSVLVYLLPPGGYDLAVGLAQPGIDLAHRWPPIRRELVERAATDQIAVFIGADHHAMPRRLSPLRAALQGLEPEHEVRISGLAEFFAAVEREPPNLPVVRGELRRPGSAWVLQDVHSARARLKRKHGAVELLLARIAEPLGLAPDRALLDHAWRTLLQCQFHDTLAGTTGDPAQREQAVRLEAVEAQAREVVERGLAALAGYDPDAARDRSEETEPRLALWNPSVQPRSGIVTAELRCFRTDVTVGPPGARRPRSGPGYRPLVLTGPGGEILPVQVLRIEPGQERRAAMRHYPDQDEVDRVWVGFRAPPVSGRGMLALGQRLHRQAPAGEGLSVGPGRLANRLVELEVSPTGALALRDCGLGETLPGLLRLLDEPDRGDLYTFAPAGEPATGPGTPIAQCVVAEGPLIGAIETRWSLAAAPGGSIGCRLLTALYADSPLVRLRLDLDNQARDHRLRARFPVEPGYARTGTAVGSVRREAARRKPGDLESEVPTAPAHRFAAAAGSRRGLAIFAEGFFEVEWTPKGELLVTLLRAVGELSRSDLPERPGHAAWPVPTPEAQEPGNHAIELGLLALPPKALAEADRLEAAWEDLFLPLVARYWRGFAGRAR